MASTGDISKALLDLLKGSNQGTPQGSGTPQGNRSPAQVCQEEKDDLHLEIYEKERLLSPRELHKWRKSLFSVYVGRLPSDVTVRELVQLFIEVAVPKDVFVVPNEGNNSYTYGFLRFATLAEAHKAVSRMNGRILGNRHLVVEISSETRSNISDKEGKEVVCDASDRLLRKEYPTFRRRSLPDKQEDLVQSKLLQSISKLKSDKASVVNTGCKDGQESSGPSFLDKLEEILKKVIKEVPGETTTRSTADEGPVCTIPLEPDTRQNGAHEVTESTTQSPGSPPINGENRSPLNSLYSYAKPVVNSIPLLPESIGLDMREDMPQNSLETPKSTQSPGSLPINGENHSPINSLYSYAKPVVSSIPRLPESTGLDMREDMRQNSLETPKSTQSPGSLPINGENRSPINSLYSYAKPVVNSIPLLPESTGLDMREDMRQNSLETPKSTQSPGSLPINVENRSPINSAYSYAKPVVNSIPLLPESTGLDMREDMRQNSLETPKSTQSPGSLPINGENRSPINSAYSYAKPVVNSIPLLPESTGLDMREDMRQNSLETPKSTQSPGSLPTNSENRSPINSVYSYAKPVVNSIPLLPESIGLDMREDMRQNSLETPKSTQSHSPINSEYSCAKSVDNSITFLPGPIDLDHGFTEPKSEQSMHKEKASDFPVEARKADSYPSTALPLTTKFTLTGDDHVQKLKLSEGQNDTKGSSLDPYMMSKMRDIPCQDIRFRSRETSPIVPSERSPVINQVSRVSRSEQEALINGDGSNHEGFRSQEPSPIVRSERSPVVNQVSRARKIEEALFNVDWNNREGFRSQETSPIGPSGRSPVVNQVSRARMIEEALINADGNNRVGIRSETNASERSPVINQVSRMSRTDAEMDAAACTPFNSGDNESPSIKSRNVQGQTHRTETKEIKATNGSNGHVYSGLSFQKQISNNSDDGSGRHPENTQQLAPNNVTISPGIIQGSTQRSLQHDGDEAEERVIGVCPTAEERGNGTKTQVHTPEFNGKKVSHSDSFDEEKYEDRKDMEESYTQKYPQQTTALEQNQPKEHQEQLPLQQEQLSLKQRSLHELQLKLEGIVKENERLHSALPDHYKDKKTSGMYPDKEMLNLEKSIHNYEVEYQREMEITVTRNAEHELLYEREKLSAAFDTNLQKELDLELKTEILKNEIKLANMANQLLVFYQKRNDMH